MKLLRTELPDEGPLTRALRELAETLERLLYLGDTPLPLLRARWVEVAGSPQAGTGRTVHGRSGGALTREIPLRAGLNLVPNPLGRRPDGRLLVWQSADGTLLDRDPSSLSPPQDPTKWLALEPTDDMTVRLQVF